jgi:AAA-like domain/CHAT domain
MTVNPRKILILAANPLEAVQLRLAKEVEEIRMTLQLAENRDKFEIESRGAVHPGVLQQYMYDIQPQIVHFSGHGTGSGDLKQASLDSRKLTVIADVESDTNLVAGGLVFEDEDSRPQLISGKILANLFKLFDKQVVCVVLNACYSEDQAKEIIQYIPYVIGMKQAIGDDAARQFSQGFYRAIWADRSIEDAFASGVNAIELQGIPEELTPVLLKRSELSITSCAPSLENPEGLVRIQSKFYIPSIYEDRGYRELQKPGSLIRIKSPSNMGKSSLMLRVLDQVKQLGYRTVIIDLDNANQKFFASPDMFMQWFCASVGKPLEVRVKVEEYWDDIFGSNDNSTEYFEKYLLEGIAQPLALAIDNFDRVFDYPDIEADFCGLLRGWHEMAKTNDLWNNLRLVIVHSQESYAKVKDINQSPFNVGLPIELGEFTSSQVQSLVKLHGLDWPEQGISQLMSLVGGHPYLVRVALYHIASGDITLEEFLKNAATEAGFFSNYLAGHLSSLEKYPELGVAMKAVVMSDVPIRLTSEDAFKLTRMGLVVRLENDVQPRCALYRKYFRDRLGGI